MSNPYTEPSISGYNASAPPDDGSNSASNEITWAKHKDKLGDPLKNYSDAINSAITSAFDKNFLNAVSAHSSSYTVLTGDRGKLLDVSNTVTIDLLAAATAGVGFAIAIRNAGSGVVTVDGDSAEAINGSLTLVLQVGGWAILECDGSDWSTLSGVNGITANTIELNQLDESARAVSNYNSGVVYYINTQGQASSPAEFDVDANVTATTAETVGPTGSGADHIWASLDSYPTGISAIAIAVYLYADSTGSGNFNGALSATHGDTAATLFAKDTIAAAYGTASGANERVGGLNGTAFIPVNSTNVFSLYYDPAGGSGDFCTLFLKGWIE